MRPTSTNPPARRTVPPRVVFALLIALVSACGGDDGTTASSQPSTPGTEPTADPGAPGTCENLDPCDAVITRSDGLADGDVVGVRVAGWEPGTVVGIAQCADAADPDNPQGLTPGPDRLPPGDVCNVLDLPGPAQTETADESGVVAFDYEVVGGARMVERSGAGVTCDAEHDCVLNLFLSGANRFSATAPIATFPLRFG